MLRLKGFAVVHIDYLDEKPPLRLGVVRKADEYTYEFRKLKRGNMHQYLWTKFSEFYPEMCSRHLGRILINDRVRWNYDLYLPSRVISRLGKEEARLRWENNFFDPDFGKYPDPGAAEYYHDLMASIGYKEAGSGEYIQECVKLLTEIARKSQYQEWYTTYFSELGDCIED